jgi:hypothetical protein
MTPATRKAAIAAWKDRRRPAGVYALRCLADGACWIGRTADLEAIGNRHFFALRQGSHTDRTLQAAYAAHGAAAFRLEVLERLTEDDLPPYARDEALKDMLARWRTALGARVI